MRRFKKPIQQPVNGHQMVQQISTAGPEVRDRFLSNLRASWGDKGAEAYLSKRYVTAEHFLKGAFAFERTSEGPVYWHNVVTKCHGTIPWDKWYETYVFGICLNLIQQKN